MNIVLLIRFIGSVILFVINAFVWFYMWIRDLYLRRFYLFYFEVI